MSSNDSDSYDDGMVVYTADELISIGLKLAGYSKRRMRRAKCSTNERRLIDRCGPKPVSCAQVWEDLQTTSDPEAFLKKEHRHAVDCFLMSYHFVRHCPVETEWEAMCDEPTMKMRDWCWFFLEKTQALKRSKIVWPEDHCSGDKA